MHKAIDKCCDATLNHEGDETSNKYLALSIYNTKRSDGILKNEAS